MVREISPTMSPSKLAIGPAFIFGTIFGAEKSNLCIVRSSSKLAMGPTFVFGTMFGAKKSSLCIVG